MRSNGRDLLRITVWGLGATLAVGAPAAPAANAAAADRSVCEAGPSGTPSARISNGLLNAVVLLPDADHGYYRGARFDWSGVIWCLAYKGHSYFGEWFAQNDNRMKDPITGPVEEFRSADGESSTAYDAAKPGGLFVKPGVGVLRRIDDQPYRFNTQYPIVDHGKWQVRASGNQVAFRQTLSTPLGIAYVYDKALKFDAGQPVLTIEHSLHNTGKKPLDIQVYDHDFFVIDRTPTGPDMQVQFRFTPKIDKPLGNGARLDGDRIVYDSELTQGQAAGDLSGFSTRSSDFDFVVENARSGVGVEETGSLPLSKLVFWSNPKTVCPEAYVHLTIEPGQTGHWSIKYRFFAP